MRRLLLLPTFVVIGFALVPALDADVKISYLSGPVTVFRNGASINASRGMVLSTDDKIKTEANARATLTINENSRMWVTPGTELAIGEVDQGNTFKLLIGRIRAKAKLLAGKKFQVSTPVSVCSVRGTFWNQMVTQYGGTSIQVGNGAVGVAGIGGAPLLTGNGGSPSTFAPPPAPLPEVLVHGGEQLVFDSNVNFQSPPAVVPMSPQEIAALEQEQQQDEAQEAGEQQQQQQQQQGENREEKKDDVAALRAEMQNIVSDVQTNLSAAHELTNEIKEGDFSAGRTLRDVHGNVVRVEQHLLRPDDQTLQLLNLTKRSEYVYSDRQGWGFTVPNTSRLDVMDVKIKMNMALPDDLSAWPSYISSKGDSLHPQTVDVKLTNQSDEMLSHGEWRLKDKDTDEKGKTLSDDKLVFDAYVNGWKVDPNYTSPDDGQNFPEKGKEPDDLYMWAISPTMHLTKDGQDKYVKMYTEAYAINNNGSILRLNDFTSTSEDPFTVFKQVAGEQIVFCRDAGDKTKSFFTHGNLDLVYIPDLAVFVGQKLATQAGNLTNNASSK